jgi:hypothetical protein
VRAGAALAVLGTGSVLAIVRTGGYHVDPARVAKLRALAPWQLLVVDALVARFCASDVPYGEDGAPPSPTEVGAAEFVDTFLAAADRPIRRDVLALLSVVEHGYPLACGERHRFTALDAAAQDRVLARMEASSVDMLRGAFGALKSLTLMAYYRDPRTWGILGYDGPLVARPDKGWTPARNVPRERRSP